jgi:hypothetical protein
MRAVISLGVQVTLPIEMLTFEFPHQTTLRFKMKKLKNVFDPQNSN